MGFRFWRRVKIAPGVTLNLSKSGGSISVGPRGAKLTVGPRGSRATVGLPGTGLSYTTHLPTGKPSGRRKNRSPSAAGDRGGDDRSKLTLGFFKRLTTPADERHLIDGCRELVSGNRRLALRHLEQASHLADGAYLAGFVALADGRRDVAARYLVRAAAQPRQLGRWFSKYGICPRVSFAITDQISVEARPDIRSVLLGLVEAYQHYGQWQHAITCLKRLRRLEPDDLVIKLSLAEVLLEAAPDDRRTCRQVLELAREVSNDSPIATALLLYKGKALRRMGMLAAARDTLSQALRRKKGRSADLLRDIRYERALVYEELGQRRRARAELETIFADAPDYADVARRLGMC